MVEQKCCQCKVKMTVPEYSIKYKFCDLCKIEKRQASQEKFKSKDPLTIKRLPRCECGEILRRTSCQYNVKSKKFYHYTGYLYCMNCKVMTNEITHEVENEK